MSAYIKVLSNNAQKLLTNLRWPTGLQQQELHNVLLGGIMLAISAFLFYFIFGKTMGRRSLIQQITIGKIDKNFAIWATMLAGVIFCSAFIKQLYHEHYIDFMPFDSKSYINKLNQGLLVISGFLIGLGISWAGGITFGHAMTGIPRRKFASFVSVLLFVISAYFTNKYKLINYLPLQQLTKQIKIKLPNNIKADYYIHGCLVLPFLFFVIFKDKSLKGLIKYIINFIIGIICCLGMMIGGMTQRSHTMQIFNYDTKNWDPSIGILFLTTIVLNFIIYSFLRKYKITPVFATQMEDPKQTVSIGLILGSIIFGIGWGLGGICTGPFYAMIPLPNLKIPFYWGLSCFAGMKIGQFVAFVARKIFTKSQKKI